jgi:excinuclease ABC subunit C
MRDEAHRFGITHHRNRRSKTQIVSVLDSIKGVGEKTRIALITHFKSLKRVREASIAELADVVGQAKAQIIYKALKQN